MPGPLKAMLYSARHAWFLQRKKGLRARITRDYAASTDPEIREVMAFIEKNPQIELPIGVLPPYEWVSEYNSRNVRVEGDGGSGLPFVIVDGHRIFFPRTFPGAEIQSSVSIGLMEQDIRSPHRYVTGEFNVDDGDIGVFIGASNGIFCASLIDRLSKAYLFEPDPVWHQPLQKTFSTCADKVEILPLAVSAETGPGQTSLDDFFKDRPGPNFIQADVEGAEIEILKGAKRSLSESRKLRLSLCTYHNSSDFKRFETFLRGAGYEIGHSRGYFFMGVRFPYFRRGIMYAWRVKNAL
jgi:Methyltransferase FkbM domain